MTLFSQQHIEQQKQIHEECPAYGAASQVFAPMVSELVNANNIRTLLDYGSGQGTVPQNLELNHKLDVQLYDPAVEKFAEAPKPAEMVICLDVLDAVEPDHVDEVLDDLAALTEKMAFFSINTQSRDDLAVGGVSEGQAFQPPEWWLPKIMARFELYYFSRIDNGFVVVLNNKKNTQVQ